MYKLSVIIPVYNVEKYFERCIRSLFEQTLLDIEYIFVNDCTPDNSMNILYKLLEEYPIRKDSVKVINNVSNYGLWYSRQVGMKIATGKYVIICDSDDWLESEAYELLYNKATIYNADIVVCGFFLETIRGQKIYLYPYLLEDKETLKNSVYIEGFLYSAFWNKMFRRDLYMAHNVYNYDGINMWEDLGVTLRLRYYSQKTIVVNRPLYHYNRLNVSSITAFPTLKNVEDQISCVLNLEEFFRAEGCYKEYASVIDNLKFKSKLGLVIFKEIRNYKAWLSIFPEVNNSVMKFRGINLYYRIVCWCISHNLFCVGDFLINLKYIIRGIYENRCCSRLV